MIEDLDFRARVRDALNAARFELDSNEDSRLLYAALQLRVAIESLTYERAYAMRDFLPTQQLGSWQPQQVLRALMEIDPAADQGAALWIGIEETPGQPAAKMEFVGAEHVLSMKTISKNYHALSAFLHSPTIRQQQERRGHDSDGLRKRCEAIAEEVDKALSSTARKLVVGSPCSFVCQKCKEPIKRKLPIKAFDYTITCLSCEAQYRITSEDGKEFKVFPLVHKVPCQVESCDGVSLLWKSDIKVGTAWECDKCHRHYSLSLGVYEVEVGA